MIQELKSIVRYSETDESGRLSLPALVNYFQDVAELHGDTVGIGFRELEKQHLAWLLSSWQIVIDRMPELGEEILAQTWAWKFQSIFGLRNAVLRDGEGNMLASANGNWFLYDMEKRVPVRVPQEMADAYGLCPRAEMDYAPRKVPDPEDGAVQESFRIGRQNLDMNRHVNNAQYVAMARAFLPEDFRTRQLRIEYKKQAYLGDTVIPVVQKREDGYAVSLRSPGGEPYASALFLG